MHDNGVTLAPVTGTTFQPTDFEVGFALRVRAVYKDANGVIEEVFSAPTALVAGVNDAPVGTVLINDTTPTETRTLIAINAFTDADAPIDLVGGGVPPPTIYNYQWQQANATGVGGGAAGFTAIAGAALAQFTPGADQVNREVRVVVSYVDGQGFAETVTSAATTVTGDFFVGGGGADIFNGLGGNDILNGDAGADIILAGAGNDLISGGTGNDALSGEAGSDTFTYTIGDGSDAVDGGADSDTLLSSGTAAANTLAVVFNGTALTNFAGGTIAGVETIRADLLGGTDTLTYSTTTADVTVHLASGTASGFTSITNIENVTGGAGNDTFIGDANANVLNGGADADVFVFAEGFGNDTINGPFDADATGGQDLLDISALGITAANFATSVTITDLGADTRVTFAGLADTIVLTGVNGVGVNTITSADFILAL